MSTLIGALRVSLSADTAQFQAGLNKAKGQAAGAAGSIQKSMGVAKAAVAGLAAGLTVGMFAHVIKGALEFAGAIGETAQQLGVTSKELQVFRYAAGQSGVSTEQLSTALAKFSVSISKALSGSEETRKAFHAVGVELADLQTKSRTEIFGMIADAMVRQGGAAKNAAAGMQIFGRGVMGMAPLLDQGSAGINALSQAAEKLGIVLSDEQIRSADDTADKLDALKTVLQANIAGVVANNASAILDLANAILHLVSLLPTAIRSYQAFVAEMQVLGGKVKAYDPFNTAEGQRKGRMEIAQGEVALMDLRRQQAGGKSAASTSARLRAFLGMGKPKSTGMAGAPPAFLAGGGGKHKGGGHKAAADHSAEDRLRDEYQFAQDMRRANMDILRAQQDLAADYVERTTIGIEILNAEKADYDAELQYQVELGKLTKGKQGLTQAQADQLRAAYGIKDGLEREKLLQDEQTQRAEDVQKLTQGDFDRRRDILEAQSGIATTASERRAIELELLKIAYEQKKQALQNIIDTSKDQAEIENARRDLANLNQTYGADQQGVKNATRGPLEEWAASVPQTAAQINEALQSIEVQGLDGLSDAISGVITGTESLQEAFGNLAQSIISDIIKMTVKMLIFRAVSAMIPGGPSSFGDFSSSNLLLGDVPAFASGGSFSVLGRRGTDRNILSMNGLPIARVSHGERISVGEGGGSGGTLVVELRDEMLDARIAQGAGVQIMRTYPSMKADTIRSMKDGNRRRRP